MLHGGVLELLLADGYAVHYLGGAVLPVFALFAVVVVGGDAAMLLIGTLLPCFRWTLLMPTPAIYIIPMNRASLNAPIDQHGRFQLD